MGLQKVMNIIKIGQKPKCGSGRRQEVSIVLNPCLYKMPQFNLSALVQCHVTGTRAPVHSPI